MMRKLLGVSCSACIVALGLAGCDAESLSGQEGSQLPKVVFPPKILSFLIKLIVLM